MSHLARGLPAATRDLIESLAESALEIPAEERSAFLAQACGGDADLLQRVTRFVSALEASAGYLESEQWQAWRQDPGPSGLSETIDLGTQIGAYRIEKLLGRGGMGTVYLARRDDEAFDKLVALKLVSPGAGNHLVRRFRRERNILARLEHPNIARLYDAGTAGDGQPYFVMEYVPGKPIDEHCEEHRLGVDERLQILLRVCEAVQLAHRHLVIHRDLKPANILVDEEGNPKLLDFGVAKLLGTPEAGAEDPAIATRGHPLTPLFASPEQVDGKAVTTATDVYALGLLAYHLLTGRIPFAEHRSSSARMARAIAEEDPTTPSAAIDDTSADGEALPGIPHRALRRRLMGDLDAILLKSLRKEPAQRYPSVEAFADDLHQYLQGFPVQARRGNGLYKAQKFLRRHRTLAVATGSGFLLTLGFAVAMAEQAHRTAKERDRARAVEGFLIETFAQADPLQADGNVTARQMLDRGTARIARELEKQPQVRTTLLRAMGEAYLGLGALDQAQELLLEALQEGPISVEKPREEKARTLVALARTELDRSNFQGAQEYANRALAIGTETPDLAVRLKGQALRVLAHVARENADWQTAEVLLQEVLAGFEASSSTDHPDFATTLLELGRVYMERTTFGKADGPLKRALEIQARRYGPESPEVGIVLTSQAELVLYQGEATRGKELITRALEILEPALGEGHPKVREAKGYLAGAIGSLGQNREAEAIFRALIEEELPLLGQDHPQIANRRFNLGVLLARTQRLDEAEAMLRGALETVEAIYPEHHRRVALMRSGYGSTLGALDRWEEAREMQLQSLEAFRGLPPVEATGAAFPLAELGLLAIRADDFETAETHYREAFLLWKSHPDRPRRRITQAARYLAYCLLRQDRAAEAEPILLEVEPLLLDLFPPGHPSRRSLRRALTWAYKALQNPELLKEQEELLKFENLAGEKQAAQSAPAEAP